MKDVHAIIRDVMLPEKRVPTMPVGIEAAASIVSALNEAGYVIVPVSRVKVEPVGDCSGSYSGTGSAYYTGRESR